VAVAALLAMARIRSKKHENFSANPIKSAPHAKETKKAIGYDDWRN
jgi:hypothetical protein